MTVEIKEKYSFIPENIDMYIVLVADALMRGVSEAEVIQFYETRNYHHDDILDILAAGKSLYEARRDAPPKKTLIRRAE